MKSLPPVFASIIHLYVHRLHIGGHGSAMGIEFWISRHFPCHSHEEFAFHALDLDRAILGQCNDGVDWVVVHHGVASELPAIQDFARIAFVLVIDPFVVCRVQFEIDHVIQNANEVPVIMSIDAHADLAGTFCVCGIDDRLHIILVLDAVVFAFKAFVAEENAGERRMVDRIRKPFQLLGWNPIPQGVVLVVVAGRKVDVLTIQFVVVGIDDDKPESVLVKVVVPRFHPVAFQGDLVGIAVVVMIADGMVRRNLEVVVVVDVVDALLRRMREVAEVDDHIDLFLFRMIQDLVKPIPGIPWEDARVVVDIGKRAKLDCIHGRLLEEFHQRIGE
jgi:hypothetical protein